MTENNNIYVSLDEARAEIKRRWNDAELKKKIEAELGEKFIPPFQKNPRVVLNRQIASPIWNENFLEKWYL